MYVFLLCSGSRVPRPSVRRGVCIWRNSRPVLQSLWTTQTLRHPEGPRPEPSDQQQPLHHRHQVTYFLLILLPSHQPLDSFLLSTHYYPSPTFLHLVLHPFTFVILFLSRDTGDILLKICNLMPQDTGIYTCVAVNDHGSASSSASIKVQGNAPELK